MRALRFRVLAVLAAVAMLWAPRAISAADLEEQGLRAQAAEIARAFDEKGTLYRVPAVEAYLETVLRRTLGQAAPGREFQVRVVDSFLHNAGSAPDDTIYVSVDLLASLGDESELAALLGHEVAHALRGHAVQSRRAVRSAGRITVATLGLGLLPAAGGLAASERDREREADADAIGYLARAGYDPAAAVRLEERLAAAGAPQGGGWLSDHPSGKERIAAARAAVARLPAGGERGAEGFSAAIAPVRLRAALIELVHDRFDEAERDGQAVVAAAPSAAAWALLGDVARLGKSDLAAAADRYRAALALDPASAPAQRGLGLSLLRAGDRAGARAALRRYLELAPAAPDRSFVEADVQGLEGASP